jgi:hypothetical protein
VRVCSASSPGRSPSCYASRKRSRTNRKSTCRSIRRNR